MRVGVALILLGLASCGGGTGDLVLVLTPDSVVANGTEVVELRADIEFRGEVLPDGQDVTFTASQPLLFTDRDSVMATVNGGRPVGVSELQVETRGGAATAFLLAPVDDAAPLTVSASYTTVNQDALEETVTVPLLPPSLVASGRPGAGGCSSNEVAFAADQLGFSFTCDRKNVGAFVEGRPPIEIECRLIARDQFGNDLPFVPVQLFAEAGELFDRPATASSPRTIVHRIPSTLNGFPRDVTPGPEEQTLSLVEVGGSPIPGALESNPRDGLVTLLAVVRGHEAYFDANGNGTYDVGETFCDEGEPFLDVDDDGTYNPNIDSACCDSNGNGQVDGRNSRWDSNVLIGRMTHVLWTGRPTRARVTPSPASVPAQGAENLELLVFDGSFNPVAAGAVEDAIEFDLSPSNVVDFVGGFVEQQPIRDTLGMELREGFPRFVFGSNGIPVFEGFATGTDDPPERFGRRFPFTLRDIRAGSALCSQASFEVAIDVVSTPAPDYGDVRFSESTTPILSGGSVSALGGVCP
ncbi:MAG: hypothetical protein AAF658_09525 [Myxococcota bacterium]